MRPLTPHLFTPQLKAKKPPLASNGVAGKGKTLSGQPRKADAAAGVKRSASSKWASTLFRARYWLTQVCLVTPVFLSSLATHRVKLPRTVHLAPHVGGNRKVPVASLRVTEQPRGCWFPTSFDPPAPFQEKSLSVL